jgi:Domain of unknown function (DUF5069)
MSTERLRVFTRDLNRVAPRSPYAALEEFPVWGARLVDKCRAELLGHAGSYHYNCPLDRRFLAAAGLEAEPLREFVSTGADDKEVAAWMSAHAKTPRENFLRWCRQFRVNPLWRLLEVEDWLHRRRNARKQS